MKHDSYISIVSLNEKTLLSVKEAAKISGLTQRQIYGMINQDKGSPLWGVKIGHKTMIKREPFINYLNHAKEITRF